MHRLAWILATLVVIPFNIYGQPPHSLYASQEKRAIKTLSEEEMQALLSGQHAPGVYGQYRRCAAVGASSSPLIWHDKQPEQLS